MQKENSKHEMRVLNDLIALIIVFALFIIENDS